MTKEAVLLAFQADVVYALRELLPLVEEEIALQQPLGTHEGAGQDGAKAPRYYLVAGLKYQVQKHACEELRRRQREVDILLLHSLPEEQDDLNSEKRELERWKRPLSVLLQWREARQQIRSGQGSVGPDWQAIDEALDELNELERLLIRPGATEWLQPWEVLMLNLLEQELPEQIKSIREAMTWRRSEFRAVEIDDQEKLLNELLILEPADDEVQRSHNQLKQGQSMTPSKYLQLKDQQRGISEQKAEELLHRTEIRILLCSAIQAGVGDVFTMANTVTQILAPLAIAGTLSIPMTPVLFASIVLLISRVGIASICADYSASRQG